MSLDYPGGPNVITSVLIRGRQEVKEKRGFHAAGFQEGGRGLEPRNAVSL